MSLGEYLGAGAATTKLLLHLNGNSNDSSGNGNNGTNTSITYGKQYGKFNDGALFTQTSRINIPSQDYLNLQSQFTISAWVYPTSYGGSTLYTCTIMQKDQYPATGRCFTFTLVGTADAGNTGKLRFIYNVPSNTSIYSTGTIPLNTWSHVSIVSTQGTYVFYRNATNIGSGNINITPQVTGTLPLSIGALDQSIWTGSLIGRMDEVIIENRAWTQQEVQKYYTNALGRFATW